MIGLRRDGFLRRGDFFFGLTVVLLPAFFMEPS